MCRQPTQPLPLRPLCRRYSSSSRHYDAFFLQGLPPRANLTRGAAAAAAAGMPAAAEQAPAVLQYSVLVNQTAIHGLPAAITQAHAALLRWLTGDPSADMRSASHPLPVLPHEQDMRITEAAGKRTCMHPGGNAMQPHGAWVWVWHALRSPAQMGGCLGGHPTALPSRVPRHPAGSLLLVMCVVLAAAVLSASFAVFLVRWARGCWGGTGGGWQCRGP